MVAISNLLCVEDFLPIGRHRETDRWSLCSDHIHPTCSINTLHTNNQRECELPSNCGFGSTSGSTSGFTGVEHSVMKKQNVASVASKLNRQNRELDLFNVSVKGICEVRALSLCETDYRQDSESPWLTLTMN